MVLGIFLIKKDEYISGEEGSFSGRSPVALWRINDGRAPKDPPGPPNYGTGHGLGDSK